MRPLPHLAEPDPPPFDREGAPAPRAAPASLHPADTLPDGARPARPSPALATLYRRHAAWLLALLRLRYGRDTAEDLLQETFLRAAASGRADEVRHPRAWLATVALNAARDLHRRRQARPTTVPGDAQPRLDRLADAPHQDQALTLKQVVLGLPPHLREVLLLSRFAGLTQAEIARRLGISPKTVEWRMTRALALCARRLRD